MKRLIVLSLILAAYTAAQLVPTVGIEDPVTHQLLSVANGGIGVAGVGNSAGTAGQQAVTASAVVLPAFASKQVCLMGIPGNPVTIYVGFSSSVTTTTGFPLPASVGICLPASNVNLFYVIAGTTGGSVGWIATN